jgi:hypothetical protein
MKEITLLIPDAVLGESREKDSLNFLSVNPASTGEIHSFAREGLSHCLKPPSDWVFNYFTRSFERALFHFERGCHFHSLVLTPYFAPTFALTNAALMAASAYSITQALIESGCNITEVLFGSADSFIDEDGRCSLAYLIGVIAALESSDPNSKTAIVLRRKPSRVIFIPYRKGLENSNLLPISKISTDVTFENKALYFSKGVRTSLISPEVLNMLKSALIITDNVGIDEATKIGSTTFEAVVYKESTVTELDFDLLSFKETLALFIKVLHTALIVPAIHFVISEKLNFYRGDGCVYLADGLFPMTSSYLNKVYSSVKSVTRLSHSRNDAFARHHFPITSMSLLHMSRGMLRSDC